VGWAKAASRAPPAAHTGRQCGSGGRLRTRAARLEQGIPYLCMCVCVCVSEWCGAGKSEARMGLTCAPCATRGGGNSKVTDRQTVKDDYDSA